MVRLVCVQQESRAFRSRLAVKVQMHQLHRQESQAHFTVVPTRKTLRLHASFPVLVDRQIVQLARHVSHSHPVLFRSLLPLKSLPALRRHLQHTVVLASKMLPKRAHYHVQVMETVLPSRVVTATHRVMIKRASSVARVGTRPRLPALNRVHQEAVMSVTMEMFALATLPATTRAPSSVEHPLTTPLPIALSHAAQQTIVNQAKLAFHSPLVTHQKQICLLSLSSAVHHSRKPPCRVQIRVLRESIPTVQMANSATHTHRVLRGILISVEQRGRMLQRVVSSLVLVDRHRTVQIISSASRLLLVTR